LLLSARTRGGDFGTVNKGACQQLLIKCYLATGQFDKAIATANDLINSSGYSLMTNSFGTFVNPMPTFTILPVM
jgi:Trk-type K+ transport system membrane component